MVLQWLAMAVRLLPPAVLPVAPESGSRTRKRVHDLRGKRILLWSADKQVRSSYVCRPMACAVPVPFPILCNISMATQLSAYRLPLSSDGWRPPLTSRRWTSADDCCFGTMKG